MPIESTGEVVFQGGPPGPGNTIGIGTISTGPAGSQASASISGASPNQALNLTIPKGDQGLAGPVPWAPIVAWATGLVCTAAAPATQVSYGNEAYVCTANHTAGTFSTDLAAGRWIKVAAKGVDGTNGTTGPQPWTTPPTAWAASTAYTAGPPASNVTYNGAAYICSTSHTSGASFDSSKFTLLAAAGVANTASGAPLQRVPAQTAVVGTTTMQTPISDAAPTTSNTTLVSGLAFSITPKSGSRIRVRAVVQCSLSVVGAMVAALFQGSSAPAQGSGAAAVASNYVTCAGNGYNGEVVVTFDLVAASAAPIYFAVGVGSNNSGTLTVNGTGGSRNFGGTTFSHVEVEEFAA